MSENNGAWAIDPGHSTVGFKVRHLVSNVRGQFSAFSGSIDGNPTDLTGAKTHFAVQMDSVDTHQTDRDKHLRTSDFFDVPNHPVMSFASTRVERLGESTYTVYGNLSLRGVTREVPVKVEFLGIGQDPWGGTRAGFNAWASINRKDYGVNWNQTLEAGGLLVGDKVDITIELEVVKQ